MEFTLHIPPIACPRPRITRFSSYYPPKYRSWRKQGEIALGEVWQGVSNPSFCDVVIEFNFKVPKSHSKKEREAALCGNRLPHGDIDNLQKSVFDLLTHCKVWDDDTQVGSICAWKQYAEENSIVIRIKWRE